MTFNEKINRLSGIFAYDVGATDSGVKDDEFKARLRDNTDGETEKLLTELAKQLLNDSDYNYTIEDVKELIDWAEAELCYYL